MIDEITQLIAARGPAAEPPTVAGHEAPAGAADSGVSPRRPPPCFPPRLEISPLTIRRPTGCGGARLPVH